MNYDEMRGLMEHASDFAEENDEIVALTLSIDKDSGDEKLTLVHENGAEMQYGQHRRYS